MNSRQNSFINNIVVRTVENKHEQNIAKIDPAITPDLIPYHLSHDYDYQTSPQQVDSSPQQVDSSPQQVDSSPLRDIPDLQEKIHFTKSNENKKDEIKIEAKKFKLISEKITDNTVGKIQKNDNMKISSYDNNKTKTKNNENTVLKNNSVKKHDEISYDYKMSTIMKDTHSETTDKKFQTSVSIVELPKKGSSTHKVLAQQSHEIRLNQDKQNQYFDTRQFHPKQQSIFIHIGNIEIRNQNESRQPLLNVVKNKQNSQIPSLGDYLKKRSQGGYSLE